MKLNHMYRPRTRRKEERDNVRTQSSYKLTTLEIMHSLERCTLTGVDIIRGRLSSTSPNNAPKYTQTPEAQGVLGGRADIERAYNSLL